MKIAFCAIVKDDSELNSLKKLCASVASYVDSIHITANGKDIDGIQEYVTKNGWDYSYLPWNKDFSQQRNFNFSRAPKGTDYIFWCDADDVLVNGQKLREVAQLAKDNGKDCVFFTYWYGCRFDGEPNLESLEEVELTQMRERLIRPGSVIWKKRIHETPVEVGHDFTYTKYEYDEKDRPVVVLHLGADRHIDQEKLNERQDRNRELLELELEDERKQNKPDPRTILYLMKILTEDEDQDTLLRCVRLGKEYLSMSGWDEERALCLTLMGRCAAKLQQYEEATILFHKASEEYPHDPLIYLYLAETYYKRKNYRSMKHWLDHALSIDLDESHTTFQNTLQMKVLASSLSMYYFLEANKNIRKAEKAADDLLLCNPIPEVVDFVNNIKDLADLDRACENIDKLIEYYESIGDKQAVFRLLETLPQAIAMLPFAVKLRHKHYPPKVWKQDEICYFANFGQGHFEKWDGRSIQSGIGGSETAVIRLSEEWTKIGYKVTVYGDPQQPCRINGVTYLPWFHFNMKDNFNILIQWRNSALAGKVKCKKFFVDLHDVFATPDFRHPEAVDGIFVKSEYHKSLAPELQDKMIVIGNGI